MVSNLYLVLYEVVHQCVCHVCLSGLVTVHPFLIFGHAMDMPPELAAWADDIARPYLAKHLPNGYGQDSNNP